MRRCIHNKMKITPILTALLMSVVVRAEVSVRYYYCDVDAQTYVPLTQELIKKSAPFSGELRGNVAEYLLLLASRATREGSFDPNNVRLLIESSDGKNVIYIDKFSVAASNGMEYPVSPKIFMTLVSGLDMRPEVSRDEISYDDWLKISSLREELPGKIHDGQSDWPWLTFAYGLASGALATFLVVLLGRRRKPAKP